jgi:hypothetical protein
MSIVRRPRADIDKAKLLAELATRPPLSREEIDAQAIEDGDAWPPDIRPGALACETRACGDGRSERP